MSPEPVHLPALIEERFGLPRSQARRLIALGWVRIDDEVVEETDFPGKLYPPRVSIREPETEEAG